MLSFERSGNCFENHWKFGDYRIITWKEIKGKKKKGSGSGRPDSRRTRTIKLIVANEQQRNKDERGKTRTSAERRTEPRASFDTSSRRRPCHERQDTIPRTGIGAEDPDGACGGGGEACCGRSEENVSGRVCGSGPGRAGSLRFSFFLCSALLFFSFAVLFIYLFLLLSCFCFCSPFVVSSFLLCPETSGGFGASSGLQFGEDLVWNERKISWVDAHRQQQRRRFLLDCSP